VLPSRPKARQGDPEGAIEGARDAVLGFVDGRRTASCWRKRELDDGLVLAASGTERGRSRRIAIARESLRAAS